ncbi:MAG: manganese catalase family protein [Methylibium sp.]|uniref:manganese catalase family protein n=1 Tax=Methylibium sp. TaxID=2067992 RepID=UPI0017D425D7|nr:manganese catalase family protein [Methylibium sp.]MBA3596927.1 manganese catalase family protein [Methylibium sp.]
MFFHNKALQYTVRVGETNPGLANLMLEQFGGPQGELAAACRYFTQYLAEDDPGRKDLLIDIATEELSHLEMIGTLVAMLNKGAKGRMAEGVEKEAELYRSITENGNSSHVTQVLYGGGPALTNSGGVPWTAAYVDTIGDPTCDLRSNIAAESRAKIVYERLIYCTDDPDVKDALNFLMTREIAHQLSFEKALYSIQPNFPAGKLPGKKEYANKYYNMSKGEGDGQGPWNSCNFEQVNEPEDQMATDGQGGFGVQLSPEEMKTGMALMKRTKSELGVNPMTGAELGMTQEVAQAIGANNGGAAQMQPPKPGPAPTKASPARRSNG